MRFVSLIPKEQRKHYRCHFCEVEGSAMYVVEVKDKILNPFQPIRCCCCSQCIDLFGLDEDTKEKQLAAREVTVEIVTRTIVTVLANNATEARQKALERYCHEEPYDICAEILDVQPINETN